MISAVSDIQKKNNSAHTRPRRKQPLPHPVAVPFVSQETRERLYDEAGHHPSYEGMERADFQAYIDERLDRFLSSQPWWYGHTGGPGGADTRLHASRQQYQGRKEKGKEDSAKARVVPIKDMPEKGGETATAGSQERSAHLLAA